VDTSSDGIDSFHNSGLTYDNFSVQNAGGQAGIVAIYDTNVSYQGPTLTQNKVGFYGKDLDTIDIGWGDIEGNLAPVTAHQNYGIELLGVTNALIHDTFASGNRCDFAPDEWTDDALANDTFGEICQIIDPKIGG
jgi:hypothetical protein